MRDWLVMLRRRNPDALARGLFFLSIPILAVVYGVVAADKELFPVPLIRQVPVTAASVLERTGVRMPWYYQRTGRTARIGTHRADAMAPGLRLISGLADAEKTLARVVDGNGRVAHEWGIEWQKIWPDANHLPADAMPIGNSALVHGIAIAPNGDLIFNFDERGMVRMDPCGKVLWKLPYRTHHSIQLDEHGNIWAPGLIVRTEAQGRLPNHAPPFHDFTVVRVSPDGRILDELFVADLLKENGLTGLLHMASTGDATIVSGDTLHLNDVDTFPSSLAPGAFGPGDVLLSLRNINTVLVFDSRTRTVKYTSVGRVLRQHDADFVDGDTISVFDNNNLSTRAGGFLDRLQGTLVDPAGHYSRIVRLSAAGPGVDVRFEGTAARPFFTHVMGRQQLLPNGNTLLTEAAAGRVLEVDPGGTIVWEYFNLLGDGRLALVDDSELLPPEFDERFFAVVSSACGQAH